MVAQVDRAFFKARPGKVWTRLVAYLLFEGRPLTTRGRWINPVVLAGHRLWKKLSPKGNVEQPIFILGTGRSGTTVLGTILALHRDIGFLNEPKALWHSALGNDDLQGSFSEQPGRFRMDRDDANPHKIARLQGSYTAYLKISGASRVLDKYPELIFRTDFLNACFDDPRHIVLVRSGTDTIQSIANWSQENALSGADWWGKDRRKWFLMVDQLVLPDPFFENVSGKIRNLNSQVDMAAVEWILAMREAIHLRQKFGDAILLVRYEDFVESSEQTLKKIFHFCDLAPDEKVLTYAKSVLRPRRPYEEPNLHPAILPLFRETMVSLGYTGG